MKLIIDIDEDYLKIINKNGANNYPEEVIKNGTPIPDNATNGDVIKAIFPDSWQKVYDICAIAWWNSPYQRGVKE